MAGMWSVAHNYHRRRDLEASFVVQIALQTALTRIAEVIVSAWQLNGGPGVATRLDGPAAPSSMSMLINVHETMFQNGQRNCSYLGV